jgi:hypothetical protein
MASEKSMEKGRALLEELKKCHLEDRLPTERLFWDSPLTAEDVRDVQETPRLQWLLAWKGELFNREGEDSLIPKPMLLAVTWGQDKRLVTRLAAILDRQALELKRLLKREKRSNPDFFKWVKSSQITARLLR